VSSTGFHLGGGVWMTAVEERLAAGAEGFAPPLFSLNIHLPRASAGIKAYGTFQSD